MCGIAVREDFAHAAGPASAVLGLGGQLGATLAGAPLGAAVDRAGWSFFLPLMAAVAWLHVALYAPLVIPGKRKSA